MELLIRVESCPRYEIFCNDKPNHHDSSIIRELVLLDGSILKARYVVWPTHDCLFDDSISDGNRCIYIYIYINGIYIHFHCLSNKLTFSHTLCSLLKIWNLNKLFGIVGIFNCQRVRKWPLTMDFVYVSDPTVASLTIIGPI